MTNPKSKEMALVQDRRLEFQSNWTTGISWCWLRVYQEMDSASRIVVLVEPINEDGHYANPGTSITNAAERLATIVKKQFLGGLEPVKWIHYYPARGKGVNRSKEEFSEVTFQHSYHYYSGTHWQHIERALVEELLGQEFTPLPSISEMLKWQTE